MENKATTKQDNKTTGKLQNLDERNYVKAWTFDQEELHIIVHGDIRAMPTAISNVVDELGMELEDENYEPVNHMTELTFTEA